jgi:hypothetical protein
MAFPSWLLVSVGGRRSQRPGPSPTLGSLGPSHYRRHKSRVSLRGPPCALGVSGIPFGEVRDNTTIWHMWTKNLRGMDFNYGKLWTSIGPLNHASTLMWTKVLPPAYRCIQEFLTKASVTFFCFLFIPYNWSLDFLISLDFCFADWKGPYSSKYQA